MFIQMVLGQIWACTLEIRGDTSIQGFRCTGGEKEAITGLDEHGGQGQAGHRPCERHHAAADRPPAFWSRPPRGGMRGRLRSALWCEGCRASLGLRPFSSQVKG